MRLCNYVRQIMTDPYACQSGLSWTNGVPRGGFGCSNPPPPRNSVGPPKNRAKLNPIVKTVKKKMLSLGRQHTKMFGKKAAKF